MSSSPEESETFTVLIVDCLPLRNLGLVGVFDQISPFPRATIVSLPPNDAAKWLQAESCCRMIIYNVGGDSLSNQKHLRGIRTLLRLIHSDTSLVVFSDNNTKEEVVSALNAGAHGFIFSGTDVRLARQALAFVLEGGSYFPAVKLRHGRNAVLPTTTSNLNNVQKIPALNEVRIVKEEPVLPCANFVLTERQKAVLGWLSRGDSNKTIARQLGIREGTVKVYVRQIMRKLGVVNRTQVAIAWTSRAATENGTEKHPEIDEANGNGGSINGARYATGSSDD
jgi:DNA-binding NarL/FixJ family response regulator